MLALLCSFIEDKFKLISATLGVVSLLMQTSAVQAETWLSRGFGIFPPYDKARLELARDGNRVHGKFLPPSGDPRPAVSVDGYIEGQDLQLALGNDPNLRIKFTQVEESLQEVWAEKSIIERGFRKRRLLYRLKAGELSETALNLEESGCGAVYGGLEVSFNIERILAAKELPRPLQNLEIGVNTITEDSEESYETVQAGPYLGEIKEEVRSSLEMPQEAERRAQGLSRGFNFYFVPGPELQIATELRRLPEVGSVTYQGEGCGGSDISIVTLGREKIEDRGEIADAKFVELLDKRIGQYLSEPASGATQQSHAYRIGNKRLTRHPLTPHWPIYSVEVFGDGAVTRGVQDVWDRFEFKFSLADTPQNRAGEISLVFHIERLMSLSKGAGSEPPSSSWFNELNTEEGNAEATATMKFASWLATAEKERCVFWTESISVDQCNDSDLEIAELGGS